VLREAITSWVEKEENAPSAYEKLKDIIGIARGGDPNLSEHTGRRFTEMLLEERKRRDSR
jgi:hypothetical protein